ncbi:hypothetical protein Taro_053172 [Colocasia esculenta]|uniref:Uncharacterized protein n=1 Tax=Colocasia esculenta TaxID=4460 RepID=A0A843XK73_COLES|nr:hypothetical protein [Colocasia esculenta]
MISPIPSSDSLDYTNRWRSPHAEPPSHSDRKSCSTRREISSPGRGYGCPNVADIVTPSAKELCITFCTDIRIAYVTTIRNRHSEPVDRALVSWNSVSGRKFPPGSCVLVHRLPYPPVGCGYLFARGSVPPWSPQFRIRTSTRSDSLDYVNRWRSPHAEPPSDSDRKSCSTRREISSPGRGYGCPNIADIVTPSGLFSPLQRKNWA